MIDLKKSYPMSKESPTNESINSQLPSKDIDVKINSFHNQGIPNNFNSYKRNLDVSKDSIKSVNSRDIGYHSQHSNTPYITDKRQPSSKSSISNVKLK